MQIKNACSEIITRAFAVENTKSAQRRDVVANNIKNTISSPDSTWRQPLEESLFAKIWRPIRNFIFSESYCQYEDLKSNLETLRKELNNDKPIVFNITNLSQETELHHSSAEAKGILKAYTSGLKNALTDPKSKLDEQKKLPFFMK